MEGSAVGRLGVCRLEVEKGMGGDAESEHEAFRNARSPFVSLVLGAKYEVRNGECW